MDISIIVACSENWVIGHGGKLPWRLSDDLKNFKKVTSGHCVIMGRKTFESIGKPLPGRNNLVISRRSSFEAEGIVAVSSLEAALMEAEQLGETEAFIIGGGEIFRQSLGLVDRLYLTWVHAHLQGDAFFPEIDWQQWQEKNRVFYPADEKNEYAFDWIILEK
ncbi:MAG: dihydrofolate reductase [Microscillaceae bacterium]|nr:dihydrofolate reductase [Microscillaceae bacterium]